MTVKELFKSLIVPSEMLNTDQVIRTFEANQDFILNTDIYSSEENYFFVTLFIHHYGRALRIKERYSKALPFLNRAMPLLENDAVFEQVDLRNRLRTDNRLDRGIAYYQKSNYKKAKEDFIWLTNHDTQNENYRNWLISTKNQRIGNIANWIIYIGCIAIGINFLLPRQERTIKETLIIFIGIAYIVFAILKIIQWYRNKQMKAKSN